MLTRAYQIGFYDSNLVYKIESEAILNKNFYFTKTDSLIIRRGDNSAFFDGIVPVGTSTVKDIKRDTTTVYDLDPIFSDGPGVKFILKLFKVWDPGTLIFHKKLRYMVNIILSQQIQQMFNRFTFIINDHLLIQFHLALVR